MKAFFDHIDAMSDALALTIVAIILLFSFFLWAMLRLGGIADTIARRLFEENFRGKKNRNGNK